MVVYGYVAIGNIEALSFVLCTLSVLNANLSRHGWPKRRNEYIGISTPILRPDREAKQAIRGDGGSKYYEQHKGHHLDVFDEAGSA